MILNHGFDHREVIVVVYDNDKYCMNPILSMANPGCFGRQGISALIQRRLYVVKAAFTVV